jgi:protein phosphatase
LEQLTFDHSLVWEMRAAGQITDEAAAIHLPKNIITRSLGPNPTVQVDLEGPFAVQAGDTFLLCSDGLTGPVTDAELGAIMGVMPPDKAAQTLVDLANLRGGPDNISVIVARVLGPPVASAEPTPEPSNGRGVHPLLWLVACLCILAAGGMLLADAHLPALLCGIGAAVAILVGVVQRFDRQPPLHEGPAPIATLGKGPHIRIDCPPNAEIVASLAKLSSEVRAVADEFGWEVDWGPFAAFVEKANAAVSGGDYAEAIRNHGQALSLAIAEVKKRKGNQPLSDSQVDLL